MIKPASSFEQINQSEFTIQTAIDLREFNSTGIQGSDPVNSTFGMIQLPAVVAKEIAGSQELE